jgi:hypothetical protein
VRKGVRGKAFTRAHWRSSNELVERTGAALGLRPLRRMIRLDVLSFLALLGATTAVAFRYDQLQRNAFAKLARIASAFALRIHHMD